jgi:hypothetical protein
LLLILTSRLDLTADYVIASLISLKHLYFRLNAEDIAEALYEVHFDQNESSRQLEVSSHRLDFSAVRTVWYRRQLVPGPLANISPDEASFARGELTHLIDGLLPLPPSARWVDDPENVRRAERKLRQFDAARAAGLRIPSTLVSTSKAQIADFVNRHQGNVVCKPIFRGLHKQQAGARVAYTRALSIDDLSELKEEIVFPVLVQELIPKYCDLRITVVGQQLFPVEIMTATGAVDWRHPEARPTYRRVNLQPLVAKACLDVLARLGLSCGAFDLAQTSDGRCFFLEVNPVGEWAWLDQHLGLGIRDVLVQHLMGGVA